MTKPTPIADHVRRRLREAIEAAGVSQRDVAAALGCDQSFVSQVLAGKRHRDDLDNWARLTDYVGFGLSELVAEAEAAAGELMTKRTPDVHPGKFYGIEPSGRMTEVPAVTPDTWICRRLADFPQSAAPPGGALGECSRCGARIVFNPARLESVPGDTPKVCMQCAHIQPLPIEP